MRSFNHSTSAHVKKSMHIGAKLLLLEHFERNKITKRSRDLRAIIVRFRRHGELRFLLA